VGEHEEWVHEARVYQVRAHESRPHPAGARWGRCPVGSGSEGRAVEQDVADDLADDEGCTDEGRPECDQQQVAAHG
jgi:hypothetical protein